MKTAAPALSALALILGLLNAGCSSQDPEQQLRAAWRASAKALNASDSHAFCDMLSDKARRYVLDGVRRSAIPRVNSCETLFAKIFAKITEAEHRHFRTSKLITVNIDGDQATTFDSTQGDAPTAWIRQDGQWRIDDVGF